ncbi:Nif3-like dinuclear metal center hexameric protein [Endozoicomonas sp. SM1973]|uniref:GTP cyclohydrolase 1 type 2 homolog n=1 Tax=Spartinivicinus marinus TaxID=2994442 RepID=A0A853I6E8_9GAMM|nr:Nif3-like dinuclear metal center hexameric protein [Spartinivicinus marinus]MCX4025711.1 Nif3-like dinuclear metal center hexameric protein [Spartinivicinus marinus]NYZ65704.1 Nif3-like dinuclear metal center hexameric protein [Spartinivicinus marinus]
MAISRQSLLDFLGQTLEPQLFKDYCPNGLQVEGKDQIKTIVTGVTASLALIEAAIEKSADAIIVHHGYFWKGEAPVITGMKKRRLELLFKHEINLFAYHLPLDAHPVLGNNVQLANQLNFIPETGLEQDNLRSIGLVGSLAEALSLSKLGEQIQVTLGREPLLISGGDQPIKRIAWCTGAAQGFIDQAITHGVDAYLTGEISEPTVHTAREMGVHFIAAGHHATERYGVKALGEHIQQQLGINHYFIDIDNPV